MNLLSKHKLEQLLNQTLTNEEYEDIILDTAIHIIEERLNGQQL